MSFLLLMAICCSFVVVPAGAESLTFSLSTKQQYQYTSSSVSPSSPSNVNLTDISIPRNGAQNEYQINYSGSGSTTYLWMRPYDFTVPVDSYYTGAVGFYLSFYYSLEYPYTAMSNVEPVWSGNDLFDFSNWSVTYQDQFGNTQIKYLESTDLSTFTPVELTFSDVKGVSLSFSFDTGDSPIQLDRYLYSGDFRLAYIDYNGSFRRQVSLVVPSASYIVTESSAELGQMEDIADSIAQTNNVLSAMYGDIMSVLNSIYQRTGDMLAAQQLTNQYLVSMSNYLQQIAGNTSNIYTLLSTYMHYLQEISETADDIYAELQAFHSTFLLKVMELIGTVQTESDDIQAKMEELYERLEEWLNTAFEDAVNEDLAGEVEGVQGDMSQSESIESGVTGSMSSAFAGLDLSGFSFSSGMIAGISYVSNTWTSFYNSLGDYQIIVLLPLYIGIGLLILGYSHKIIVHASRKKDGGG